MDSCKSSKDKLASALALATPVSAGHTDVPVIATGLYWTPVIIL